MIRLDYYFREAWRGITFHRALTGNSLLALTGALVIPAVFLIVLVNALSSVDTVGSRREMVIFLHDDVPDSTLNELTGRFDGMTQKLVHMSKEDAWEEMAHELGGTELLEAVGENPLPASLRVQLLPGYRHYDAMDSITASLEGHEAVEEVQFGATAVQVMDRLIDTLTWIGLGVGAIIALVVLFIVANTIRLTVIARREIHRVMKQMGAGGAFLRAPLVLEGMIVCLLASLFALGLVYALFLILEQQLVVLPEFLPWQWMVAFVGVSGLLGAFGSLLALSRLGSEEGTQ
jgi:cell division transport system permease protein